MSQDSRLTEAASFGFMSTTAACKATAWESF